MDCGIFLLLQSPAGRPGGEILQGGVTLAQAAEEFGFSHAWVAEHHFSNYSYSTNPFTLLGYIAARTTTLRLGTAIVPVPLHHPLRTAEQAVTMDWLSGGRFELGLGKGYQDFQYQRLGLDPKIKDDAFPDQVATIVDSLRHGRVTVPGPDGQPLSTTLMPPPRNPGPPIWLVVNTRIPASIELATEHGLNCFTGVAEPIDRLTDIRKDYSELVAGRNFRIGTQRPVFVSRDRAAVRRALDALRWHLRASVGQRYGLSEVVDGRVVSQPLPLEPDDERLISEHVVFGNPDDCIRQILRLRDGLGCDLFNASFWLGDMALNEALESMRLFAEEVMPAVDR